MSKASNGINVTAPLYLPSTPEPQSYLLLRTLPLKMHCKLQDYAGLALGISSSDFQAAQPLWLSQSPAI